jgi:hypothetical protein
MTNTYLSALAVSFLHSILPVAVIGLIAYIIITYIDMPRPLQGFVIILALLAALAFI